MTTSAPLRRPVEAALVISSQPIGQSEMLPSLSIACKRALVLGPPRLPFQPNYRLDARNLVMAGDARNVAQQLLYAITIKPTLLRSPVNSTKQAAVQRP
jgi:hypothetical protein